MAGNKQASHVLVQVFELTRLDYRNLPSPPYTSLPKVTARLYNAPHPTPLLVLPYSNLWIVTDSLQCCTAAATAARLYYPTLKVALAPYQSGRILSFPDLGSYFLTPKPQPVLLLFQPCCPYPRNHIVHRWTPSSLSCSPSWAGRPCSTA